MFVAIIDILSRQLLFFNNQTNVNMKTKFSIIYLFWILYYPLISFSQPLPVDSIYLGQPTPGNTPKKFTLSVSSGFVPAERVTTSNDST